MKTNARRRSSGGAHALFSDAFLAHRGRRAVGVLASALAFGVPAWAQEVTSPGEDPIEEISVTGSRIQTSGMSTPTPVTVMTPEDLDNLAPGTLMDALDKLPQFINSSTIEDTGSVTAGSWSTVGGASTLNMRGVGNNRTLVLLDGRRVVPSNRLSTVDVNLFPQALIQRTEVVTGGASAAYGSDAITGVTNFILDTQFEGISGSMQGGLSHLGDNENFRGSLAGGLPLGDRAHLIMGAEYYAAAGIPNYDGRDWYKNWGDINYGATDGEPNQTPQRVRYENVVTRMNTFGGLIRTGPLAGIQFLSDGTPAPFHDGEVLTPQAISALNTTTPANPNGQISGSHVVGTTGSGDDIAADRPLQADQRRGSLFTHLSVDVNDDMRLSLQGIAGYSLVRNQKWGYVFTPPWVLTIYQDNAFLPESVRARMQEDGVASFQLHKNVSPRDPLYNSAAPMETSMYSVTAALDGRLPGDWRYNTYYQYGSSKRALELFGFRVDRFYRGVDTSVHPETGQIVCNSTLIEPNDGCIPINVFGRNNESQQARDWVHDSMTLDANLTQHATEFMIDGQLYDGWGAGPVFLASGVSYRRDALHQIGANAAGSPIPAPPDGPVTSRDSDGNLLYRGLPATYEGYNLIDRAGGSEIDGSFQVWEAFAETLIPIVRGVPGAEGIDLTLATRFADYQGSGSVWAWKGGFDWQIFDDVRFRLTRSRDIRAGSLSERFDVTATGGNVTDRFLDDQQYTIRSIQGGNPEVEPEHSDTTTFGLVYQPSWARGLSMSADYFDIKISGAISQIGTQNIMNDCFDYGAYCDLIQRAEDGTVDAIYNVFINVGEARTRGADVEVGYRQPVNLFGGNENIAVRAIGSHLFEASITPYASDKIERVGNTTYAPWNVTLSATYRRGPFSMAWTERLRSPVKRNLTWVEGIDADIVKIGWQSVSNVRLTYNLDTAGTTYSFYGAVSNVMDHDPGRVQGLSNIYGSIGRTYTAGMRFRR